MNVETVKESMILLKKISATISKSSVDSWTSPPEKVLAQTVSLGITHPDGNVFRDAPLFEACYQFLLHQWFYNWLGRFYSMDLETILTLETSPKGFTMNKSTAVTLTLV